MLRHAVALWALALAVLLPRPVPSLGLFFRTSWAHEVGSAALSLSLLRYAAELSPPQPWQVRRLGSVRSHCGRGLTCCQYPMHACPRSQCLWAHR